MPKMKTNAAAKKRFLSPAQERSSANTLITVTS